MMNQIQTLAKKFRTVADALDDLLSEPGASELLNRHHSVAGSHAPGKLHWTQRPENRAKLTAMHRKAVKARRQKAK